jgi:hypothetical protein
MDDLRGQESERGQSLWPMIYAPTIWAVHFCVSYGTAALWCTRNGPSDWLQWIVAAFSTVALGLIALVAWRAWRQWDYSDDWDYDHARASNEHRREFLGHAGFLLAGVSAVGVIYVTLPAFLTGVCE